MGPGLISMPPITKSIESTQAGRVARMNEVVDAQTESDDKPE